MLEDWSNACICFFAIFIFIPHRIFLIKLGAHFFTFFFETPGFDQSLFISIYSCLHCYIICLCLLRLLSCKEQEQYVGFVLLTQKALSMGLTRARLSCEKHALALTTSRWRRCQEQNWFIYFLSFLKKYDIYLQIPQRQNSWQNALMSITAVEELERHETEMKETKSSRQCTLPSLEQCCTNYIPLIADITGSQIRLTGSW